MNFRELSRDEFLKEFKTAWHVGQHVTLVGTTGDGKTVLAQSLCELRHWCIVLGTKAKDQELENFPKSFKRVKNWPPDFHLHHILYWKKPKELGNFQEQRESIYEVLVDVYMRGGYTLYMDDVFYISKTLRMNNVLQMLYTQVRSQDVSLLGSIQRPSWVPLEVINQSTHVLIFGLRDEDDVLRVAREQGVNSLILREAVKKLKIHEFVWLRTKSMPVIVRN